MYAHESQPHERGCLTGWNGFASWVSEGRPGHPELGRLHELARLRHLSPRTEESYAGWVRRYLEYHGNRDPRTLGRPEIEAFLSYLATDRRVAAATQSQALAALLFLYREVIGTGFGSLDTLVRAKRGARLPVVLDRDEVGSGWLGAFFW